jgi:outer membrane lipoprotein carrier protein
MKPAFLTSSLAATLAALALLPARGEAQSSSEAARVAAQVQAFYDQTTTVRTAFHQTHYDRLYQRYTRSRGVLTIAKPGKLRFDYLAGDGKVIVSNGRTLTAYEPGDEGGPGQYTRVDVTENSLPAALSFLTGQSRLDRDFRFRLVDAARMGWDGKVLELRGITPQASYDRIYLFVDDDARTAGVVRRVVIVDHAGNRNRFDFSRMQFNRPVDASRFAFTPPRGARRV